VDDGLFSETVGSAPIVLVRPDGSKLFIENDEEDPNVRWYETQTLRHDYDKKTYARTMASRWSSA